MKKFLQVPLTNKRLQRCQINKNHTKMEGNLPTFRLAFDTHKSEKKIAHQKS